MEKYIRQFDECRQSEKPFCTNKCPFNMDVLDFQAKMEKNNYNAAYKTFRNAVAFPEIVAALCNGICESVCPRAKIDQSVQLNLLERTCVSKATRKDPTDYNVPIKNRKIAIIGAGASGLACAARMAQKKYDVTVYEKTDKTGGSLFEILPESLVKEDIERQFKYEKYNLNLNKEIKSIDELKDEKFEAIYVATGAGGNDFGILDHGGKHCEMRGSTAIFAGGSLTGKSKIDAIAEGLSIAWTIEVYLKTGKLEYPDTIKEDKVVIDDSKLKLNPAIMPSCNGIFSDEEAANEAGRCIRCQCDACMIYCDVSLFHNKWPLKIRDEVMATVAASESMIHKSPARRMINTCTQCGLCAEVCPSSINVGGMLLEARRMLHKKNKMPGAYHQFWLNDMDFSNSKFAKIIKTAPGYDTCEYAFFPGCQLGAAGEKFVTSPYKWLLSKKPDTGLMLRCCSVPAEWAGNEELHEKEISEIKTEWESLGKPKLIMACPACIKHFKEYLPEIDTVSLYEVMEKWQDSWEITDKTSKYSIFDPCTARNNKVLETSIRRLIEKAGLDTEELPNADKHGCCGYGGHVSEGNKDYAKFVAETRCALSDNPYLVYCINCKDIFIEEGKPVNHILDIFFGISDINIKPLNLEERRANKVNAKETLLKDVWGEIMSEKPESCIYNFKINVETEEKLKKLKILHEDLCDVITYCEKNNRRTFNKETGTYSGYKELGYITFWVEYKIEGQDVEVVNVYTHRMKIKLEGVWNGVKTDIDM